MSPRANNQKRPRTDAPSDTAPVRHLEDVEDRHQSSGKGATGSACPNPNPKPSLQEENTEPNPNAARRAAEKQRAFVSRLSARSLGQLATALGVSQQALRSLGVGFDTYAYTFPMRDGGGTIIGWRLRPAKDAHQKHAVEGSKTGLFIPQGVSAASAELICEGESNTAAALTLGFGAIGRPSATGGIEELLAFLRACPVACPCIAADNDAVGTDGAETLGDSFRAAGIPSRLLVPPEPHGDLRDWLRAGLTREALAEAIQKCPILWPEPMLWTPGFSPVPNALARRGVIAKIGLGPWALVTLLMSFQRQPEQIVIVTRELLAELLGVSVSTVDRWKGELRKAGLVTWKRGGTDRADEYRVNLGPRRWKQGQRAAEK